MKIIIYLFSGTGNTRKITGVFAENLKKLGAEVVVSEIDREVVSPNDFDLLGFAYPIHAFNAPQNVLKFAKELEISGKKDVFFIKTGGEPLSLNDPSGAKLAAILRRKNCEILSEYHYVMPYNMLYRHYDSMADKMYYTAVRMAERDAADLLGGKRKKLKKGNPVTFIFRNVEQPFMNLNGRFFKVDPEKCINCGKCVNNCPQKNIKFEDGKFVFGNKCIGCVRCSFLCPKDAVKIGIINFWKVNGAYKYGDSEPETYECKYLKKSYKKYFEKNSENSIMEERTEGETK